MAGEEIVNNEDGDLVIQRSLVSYLDGIQKDMAAGFAETRLALADKASKTDLDRMERRIDGVVRDVGELQTWRHDSEVAETVQEKHDKQSWFRRNRLLTALGGAAYVFATLIAPSLHLHL